MAFSAKNSKKKPGFLDKMSHHDGPGKSHLPIIQDVESCD